MMPMTRPEIEVLLDAPDRHEHVVSAYADLTVQNGFERHVELHLRNEARAASDLLSQTRARRDLGEDIEAIRRSVRGQIESKARGAAVFSCVARNFLQVV